MAVDGIVFPGDYLVKSIDPFFAIKDPGKVTGPGLSNGCNSTKDLKGTLLFVVLLGRGAVGRDCFTHKIINQL
jgi:hypothetical protein